MSYISDLNRPYYLLHITSYRIRGSIVFSRYNSTTENCGICVASSSYLSDGHYQ